MSYEIVKKIRIEGDKVFISSSSNNVYPKSYDEYEHPFFSGVLKEKGIEELNFELLKLYEEGIYQEGVPNKWSRAIKRLKMTKEYEKFNWRLLKIEEFNGVRNTNEFRELLMNSFKIKPSKEKYIIVFGSGYSEYFIAQVTKTKIKLSPNKNDAKLFNDKIEVDYLVKLGNYKSVKVKSNNDYVTYNEKVNWFETFTNDEQVNLCLKHGFTEELRRPFDKMLEKIYELEKGL